MSFPDPINFKIVLRSIFNFNPLVEDSDSKKYLGEKFPFEKFFANNPLIDINGRLSIFHDCFEEINIFIEFLPVCIIFVVIELFDGVECGFDDVGVVERGYGSGNPTQ